MKHFWKPLYDYLLPPGTYQDLLPHPSGRAETVPVALVQEHRFVFYYWLNWTRQRTGGKETPPPHLVTFDWHKDLAPPNETEQRDLERLNTGRPAETALFSWGRLNPYNDGHILSAAYLNLIGDIHVICKQKFAPFGDFEDRFGQVHKVHIYETREAMQQLPEALGAQSYYLDIDLDYFTETSFPFGGGDDLRIMNDDEIRQLMDPRSPLFIHLFQRLAGMTIATEPKFCGGIANEAHLLALLDDLFFSPSLLSPAASWRQYCL